MHCQPAAAAARRMHYLVAALAPPHFSSFLDLDLQRDRQTNTDTTHQHAVPLLHPAPFRDVLIVGQGIRQQQRCGTAQAAACRRQVGRRQGAPTLLFPLPATPQLSLLGWHPDVHRLTVQAVQRALRLVDKQDAADGKRGGGGGPRGARPIDPREASRGKVEFVKVACG